MQVRVECHCGYKADERPLRFWLSATCYEVQEVVDQWYSPEGTWFRVKASDGNLYILCAGRGGEWTLESFRRA